MDVHFAAYNYFRGPIDAWTLCQNIGGAGPSGIDAPANMQMRLRHDCGHPGL